MKDWDRPVAGSAADLTGPLALDLSSANCLFLLVLCFSLGPVPAQEPEPTHLENGVTSGSAQRSSSTRSEAHEITAKPTGRLQYSAQQHVYLDPGEEALFSLRDGSNKRIRLVSVREFQDSVMGLTRRAEVWVEVEGVPLMLVCAPYVMPAVTQGLRIQADTTSAWLDLPKRVQFSVWDAKDPIVATNLFGFPLRDYEMFSHGTQSYNEPVHWGHRDGDPAGQRFYHNYGFDLAGYEGRQEVLSAISGVVFRIDPGEGDLFIRDEHGVILHYGHLDSIMSGLTPGAPVSRGQWVGLLGRRGASGDFSHLHLGFYLSESDLAAGASSRNLNLYPWLVAASQAQAGAAPRAVARPHHAVRTGEKVLLDGSWSLVSPSQGVTYRWEFHDGAVLAGIRAEKVYERPGCYMASLWLREGNGHEDVDFCKVKVYSDRAPEEVMPILFVTRYPAGVVRAGQAVAWRIWPQGGEVESLEVDYGDGVVVRGYRPYEALTHAYRSAGLKVMTVTGRAQGRPVMQKAKVRVGK